MWTLLINESTELSVVPLVNSLLYSEDEEYKKGGRGGTVELIKLLT